MRCEAFSDDCLPVVASSRSTEAKQADTLRKRRPDFRHYPMFY
ncbi:hypothetical protein T02_15397 [Trichinella nativa]|uniref:Uncharacterized protein n=1 Tax=Trichinella nativa TaxID=6335 RepID=A0A0V1LDI5_9BILA|nr:hypothetical protein T02_15397 [Trichinella nativa]